MVLVLVVIPTMNGYVVVSPAYFAIYADAVYEDTPTKDLSGFVRTKSLKKSSPCCIVKFSAITDIMVFLCIYQL
jgi:hypothetical protein